MVGEDVYEITNTTILYSEIGEVISVGKSKILGATATENVAKGDKVFDIDAKDGKVKSLKIVATDADKAAAKAVIDQINALEKSTDLVTDADNARTAYNALDTASAKQKALVSASVVAKLEKAEAKVAVSNAKSALDFDAIKKSNDTANNITGDLTLNTTDTDVAISWKSSNTDVIEADGTVNPPVFGEGDKEVTLTATIVADKDSSIKDTVEFKLTVKEAAQTAASKAKEVADAIKLTFATGEDKDNVKTKITVNDLSDTKYHGATITWKADPSTTVDDLSTLGESGGDITVIPSADGDVKVTLTATVTVDAAKVNKTFTVTVKGL